MLRRLMSRVVRGPSAARVGLVLAVAVAALMASRQSAKAQQPEAAAPVAIDYPLPNSIFPPDIEAPTFLFRDDARGVTEWRVEVTFASGAKPQSVTTRSRWMEVGEVDYRAVAATNELPKLTAQQSATRTWRPDAAMWEAIKKASVERAATVTISGYAALEPDKVLSRGSVTIKTSKDPVGAPIFYRDVPLMPAEVEKGVIKPLPPSAIPLIAWRLRYVDEPKGRVMIENLPTCANCHSFSSDGKTLGLDLDGPQNDKGLYAMVALRENTSIRPQDVVAWSTFKGKLGSKIRVGFMSRISPDARYVVTMVNPADLLGVAPPAAKTSAPPAGGSPARQLPKDVKGNFYVSNFTDYRFLQVFYPTRGVLAWYSKETGKLQALPGADDPRYVHTNAVWSPDGKWLVFARASARDPYPEGTKIAAYSNDPNETKIQYDLYRIPFNDGKGGVPEPIAGASANGMSNSFPKVTPDGKWVIYVQARNGLLMRPDSQLHIVPLAGGKARRMSCNTPLMNSWHSISPNGRWMAFSSKSRSPYTQMYLTHLDEDGTDSPAILIENATAANRAVNLPEFVNIGKDEWKTLESPATQFYGQSDVAIELMQKHDYDTAIAEWNKALRMEPDDTSALSNLGVALSAAGRLDEAMTYFRKALSIDPENYKTHSNLGVALARAGKSTEAIAPLRRALELQPDDSYTLNALGGALLQTGKLAEAQAPLLKVLEYNPRHTDALNNLGSVYARQGRFPEAIRNFQQGLAAQPNSAELLFNLGRALAASGKRDDGIRYVERAADLTQGQALPILDRLAALYAEAGRFSDAAATARRALSLAERAGDATASQDLKTRITRYDQSGPGVAR